MKICHMTCAHENDDVRIFHKECCSLAALYDTTLVAFGESRREKGVEVLGLGKAPESRLRRITLSARQVYKKARALDCDVYHFHDPELLPYGLKLKKKGKHVIFDSHENHPLQLSSRDYLPKWAARTIGRLYKAYETYCVRRFDAVIVPCTFGGKNIFEGRAKKTVFIENYPKPEEFSSFADIPAEEYIPSDICYTGSITEGNGLDVLTDAATELGATVVLAGFFDSDAFRDKILSKGSHIRYLGAVDRQTVRRIFAGAKIGACLSLDDGQYYLCDSFGVKVHEYMLAGLPALVSDSPFEKRMIEQYGFGLYADPGDINAVKAAIKQLLTQGGPAEQMGQKGRRAAQEKFNWGTQEKKLLELYAEIAGDVG